ncbi:Ubiquitin domain-containing protein DSK2a [Dictyocoela muelleri]|nr:Ubiquitin domain-containing protein DSK2a [Dictyocoela muelleri]
MKISVTINFNNEKIFFTIEQSETLMNLKETIKNKLGIPPQNQVLKRRDCVLEDDKKTLVELGIGNNEVIYLKNLDRKNNDGNNSGRENHDLIDHNFIDHEIKNQARFNGDEENLEIDIIKSNDIKNEASLKSFKNQFHNGNKLEDVKFGNLRSLNHSTKTDNSGFKSLISNPMVKNMFKDKDAMKSMIENMPGMKEELEKNSELRMMLNNPQMYEEIEKIAEDPEYMNQQLKNVDLAMQKLENIPGGLNMMNSLMNDIRDPLSTMMDGQSYMKIKSVGKEVTDKHKTGRIYKNEKNINNHDNKDGGINRKDGSIDNKDVSIDNNNINHKDSSINIDPLPNPWGGKKRNYVVLFKDQLEILRECGFTDLNKNIEALRRNEGDVDLAMIELAEQNDNC